MGNFKQYNMNDKNIKTPTSDSTEPLLDLSSVSKRLFKYIEIKEWEDGGVVKRIDVSSKSERQIEKIDSGMNRNLNHDQYYTCDYESEVELDSI